MRQFYSKSYKLIKNVSNKQKFIFCLMLFVLATAVWSNPIFAKTSPTLYIHDRQVTTDANPFIEQNRIMVPLRVIAENLGYSLQWNGQNKEVSISNNSKVLQLSIGKKEVISNGNKIVIDVAPMVKNNRTFVPLRYIAEYFHQVVIWDDSSKSVYITREKDRISHEKDYLGRFVLVQSDRWSNRQGKKAPVSLKVGDVGLIVKTEGDFLYLDLIKPHGDVIEDWSFAKGYVPKENCIVNPRPNELEILSHVCRLKNGEVLVKDSVNGRSYQLEGDLFCNIVKKEKDKLLIELPGGANDAWVSKKDVDFHVEYFTGNPENQQQNN